MKYQSFKMNKLFLLLFLGFFMNLNSQIIEVWKHSRPYGFYFDYSKMQLEGSTIYVHSITELANSHQYAQSISTDGIENWFTSHNQLNECFECGFASVEDVVINSLGESFAVGQQNAFPYSGRYYSRTSPSGEIVFANEFLTNPWASGFEGVCLSANESELFASGYQYTPDVDGLGPFLYRLSLNGEILDSRHLGGEFASIHRLSCNSSNQIFASVSDIDTLKFASFNSDLQVNWVTSIAKPGFSSGFRKVSPLFFSNGDILFVDFLYNTEFNSVTKIHLTRIDQSGEIIWESERDLGGVDQYNYQPIDFTIDALDNVFCYLLRRFSTNGGGIAEEEQTTSERGGKGGETQIRPALLKFSNLGDFEWMYIEPGNTDIEFSTVYPGDVITDEEGFSIISAFESQFEQGGVTYTILNPSGTVETSAYIENMDESWGNSMIYGGNRTFYSHTLGLNQDNLSESVWVVARYQYDFIADIDKKSEAFDFKVYPNPANGYLYVQSDIYSDLGNYLLTDLSGRLISMTAIDKSGKTKIDLSGISPGIYLLSNGVKSVQVAAQ
jgi:hypothetical protein